MKKIVSLLLTLALLLGLGAAALASPTGASEEEKAVYNGDGIKQNGMPTLAKAVLGEATGTKFASAMLGSGTVSGGLKATPTGGSDPAPTPSKSAIVSFSIDWATRNIPFVVKFGPSEIGPGSIKVAQTGGFTGDLITGISPDRTVTWTDKSGYVTAGASDATLKLYDGNNNLLDSKTVTKPVVN